MAQTEKISDIQAVDVALFMIKEIKAKAILIQSDIAQKIKLKFGSKVVKKTPHGGLSIHHKVRKAFNSLVGESVSWTQVNKQKAWIKNKEIPSMEY